MRARAKNRQLPFSTNGAPGRKPKLVARRTRQYSALFAARMFALDAMGALSSFDPRLRGAALSGRWRFDSLVELDVYADQLAPLGDHLRALGWRFEVGYYDHDDVQHPTFEVDGLFGLVLHVLPRDELSEAPGVDREELLAHTRVVHRSPLLRWCASAVS